MQAHSPENAQAEVTADERRRMARASVAYPIALLDNRGRVLARGRTTDISQNGLFAVVVPTRGHHISSNVVLEVTVPRTRSHRPGRQSGRKITYLAEIVRQEPLGQMIGLALEFVEKLATSR